MRLLLSTLILLSFSACKSENELPQEKAKLIQLTDVQKSRVTQDNHFAFELMKQTLAETDQRNVLISPISVSLALAMTLNGAIGETRLEMEEALKLSGMDVDEINEYYKLIQTTLPDIDPKTKLKIANSIWYRNTFKAHPDFLKTNIDYFDAEVSSVDFSSPAAVDIINKWCNDNTDGLISKILDKINPDQLMFIINAVYFKGIWQNRFEKKNTYQTPFTNELNQQVPVNMMNRTDSYAYAEDDFAQYIDMAYGNDAFCMTVILPKENESLDNMFSYLDAVRFNELANQMYVQTVNVSIPRFKVKNSFKLNPVLEKMGMRKAFGLNADLDRIASLKPLYIGFVQHDTYAEITEEGTKAAAVTTVGMLTTSITPTAQEFRVNKPFAFVIREKSTGIILFMGKMGDVKQF